MADSSKDIQLRELKDMINDLKKMIKTLQATVDAANKREEALTQERDNLKEEIDLLRKKLFGTSSEKRTLDIPGQLNFFNEAELEQDPRRLQKQRILKHSFRKEQPKNENQELQMRNVLREFLLKKSIWSFLRKRNSALSVVPR